MSSLVLYFLLAVVVSFFCSLLESCFLSINPVYIQTHLKKDKEFAKILHRLKSNVHRPLSAILTLNTLANMMGAAGVGAQVHLLFGTAYVTLASGLLAFVILVFSEIIPKTLGTSYWRTLAPFCAYSIRGLIYLTSPFVWFFGKLNKVLSKKSRTSLTREEMIATAEMGATTGIIGKKESHIIVNLLTLDSTKVSQIMTPRSVILAFNQNHTVGDIIRDNPNISFSRIPVFEGNLDSVVGMVHRYKIFEAKALGLSHIELKEYIAPLHVIPEHISVAATLDQFIKRKEHIFLVVDEYGITTGIVTLEDTIETILGVEIVDELDSVEDLRKLAVEKWKKRKQNLPSNGHSSQNYTSAKKQNK